MKTVSLIDLLKVNCTTNLYAKLNISIKIGEFYMKYVDSEFNKNRDDLFCKYCGKQCKNINSLKQHEIRCKSNPNRRPSTFSTNNPSINNPWNKGKTKDNDIRIARQAIKSSKTKKGKPGHKHTEEEKQNLREHALKNGLGGFHMRHSGIIYNGIKLDSAYEVLLAENLDANNIKWERCERFPYIFDEKLHYYTPDFYLPEYDVYLDPKNDFLINNINPHLGFNDIDKIRAVEQQNNIKIIVLNKDQLNWQSIEKLLNLPL